MIAHISRKEWKVVIAVSALAMFVSSIPMIAGLILATIRGEYWLGVTVFAPGDMAAYLASIAQAEEGAIFFSNLFTTEGTTSIFDIFWLIVGQVARVPGISSLAAFHIFRLLLIPVFVSAAYACVSYFLDKFRERMVALFLFCFSSGVGVYFAIFADQRSEGTVREFPIDLWVAESNPLMSMIHSPHFIASFTLFIAVSTLFYLAVNRSSYGMVIAAGVAALVLFQFHPFHAPTLFALAFTYVALRKIRDKTARRLLVTFLLIPSPAVIYHYARLHADSVSESMLAANLTVTPQPLHLLLGFGILWLLAGIGAAVSKKRMQKDARIFLLVWIFVQLMLVYAPLTFQR